jgi:pyruvate/2-oxoacid:ferredoxin oxidoreductase alpha subunit
MVEKRMSKMKSIECESIPPEYFGNPDAKILVVGWVLSLTLLKSH